MLEIIDTHCHLDDGQFLQDREVVLKKCKENGVTTIVVPSIHRDNWLNVIELCASHQMLYPALGMHPMFTDKHIESDVNTLKNTLNNNSVVAIGEIGLDYFVKDADRDQQKYYFEQQLQLAVEFNLPVLLHVRKAHADVLALLKQYKPVGGIAHAYNGSFEQAQEYIALGFKLGFGGTLTYENATKIRLLAEKLPLSAIVLETDAPDMAGLLHRGKRNSPEFLPEAMSSLAEIRQCNIQTIAKQTTENALAIFQGALQ